MATSAPNRRVGPVPRIIRFGAGTPLRTALLTALQARLRGPRLDSELAAGVAPWHSPAHSARSLLITGTRARRSLARSLDALLQRAQTPTVASELSTAVPLDRRAVLGARSEFEALATRLRDDAPVNAQGVAALRKLISDGAGPIYSPPGGDVLIRMLAAIRDLLDVPH